MEELQAERTLFDRNHKDQENYDKEYLNFVRSKMQELTCSVNGDYISFLIDIVKVVKIKRGETDIFSMRFTLPKRDNI